MCSSASQWLTKVRPTRRQLLRGGAFGLTAKTSSRVVAVADPQPGLPESLGAHDVRLHLTGTKHFRQPVVGALNLGFDALDLIRCPDARISITIARGVPQSRVPCWRASTGERCV